MSKGGRGEGEGEVVTLSSQTEWGQQKQIWHRLAVLFSPSFLSLTITVFILGPVISSSDLKHRCKKPRIPLFFSFDLSKLSTFPLFPPSKDPRSIRFFHQIFFFPHLFSDLKSCFSKMTERSTFGFEFSEVCTTSPSLIRASPEVRARETIHLSIEVWWWMSSSRTAPAILSSARSGILTRLFGPTLLIPTPPTIGPKCSSFFMIRWSFKRHFMTDVALLIKPRLPLTGRGLTWTNLQTLIPEPKMSDVPKIRPLITRLTFQGSSMVGMASLCTSEQSVPRPTRPWASTTTSTTFLASPRPLLPTMPWRRSGLAKGHSLFHVRDLHLQDDDAYAVHFFLLLVLHGQARLFPGRVLMAGTATMINGWIIQTHLLCHVLLLLLPGTGPVISTRIGERWSRA